MPCIKEMMMMMMMIIIIKVYVELFLSRREVGQQK